MATIQRVTGMQDVLPEDIAYRELVEGAARVQARRNGFVQVDVPILEPTELFVRGVGKASDFFVQKEMYTFEDEDGASLTMRPEFTAGVIRAYIANGLHNWTQPAKLFTIGPLFRRERPQAGRFRQHRQFNCEIIGAIDPAADLEVMLLAMNLYRDLGFQGLNFQLNSTGCPTCKPAYVALLRDYLGEHMEQLAEVDQKRLRRNPLRILDSKEAGMEALLAGAPHIIDHLCEDCADHFAELRLLLDALDQPYAINFRLVRGIDYYVKTVFEVWAEGIGAQAALVGGGRYDGLSEAIGGPQAPSVGFGSGIERIILALKQLHISPPPLAAPALMVTHFGGDSKVEAVRLTSELRDAGFDTILAFARGKRSMKSQLREANRRQVQVALILGAEEIAAGNVVVKPMQGGSQELVSRANLVGYLNNALSHRSQTTLVSI